SLAALSEHYGVLDFEFDHDERVSVHRHFFDLTDLNAGDPDKVTFSQTADMGELGSIGHAFVKPQLCEYRQQREGADGADHQERGYAHQDAYQTLVHG